MRYGLCLLICMVFLSSCKEKRFNEIKSKEFDQHQLTLAEAKRIFALPVHCLEVEYPNRLGQTLGSDADLKTPKALRPIFYGCFDWHSSVHGYWTIVKLLKEYPELDEKQLIREKLDDVFTPEKVAIEMQFFDDYNNRNFERTYGWAWLFQLQGELLTWDDSDAKRWAIALGPLIDLLVGRYEEYLPKLNYPIRTGTHDNSAFSMSMSLDYARLANLKDFEGSLITHAKRLFGKDQNCNLSYEPSGHDFLSPCLEEARLMSKIYNSKSYESWLQNFLPELFQPNFSLEAGKVSDRTDGHLVHLDGLNFSRASCLKDIAKQIPELEYLNNIAKEHLDASFVNITDDDYMGSHWLGSFALYAMLP